MNTVEEVYGNWNMLGGCWGVANIDIYDGEIIDFRPEFENSKDLECYISNKASLIKVMGTPLYYDYLAKGHKKFLK